MKLIKEIIIFSVMVAAIYGLFALNSSSSKKIDTDALIGGGIEQLSSDIDAQWATLNDWDDNLYQKQMTRIAQSYSAGLFDATARKTLYDRVNKQAYTKATVAMNEEISRSNCQYSRLTANYNGLMTVTTREASIATLPDVARVLETYSLYTRVMAFNSMNLGLTPRFNIGNLDWTPKFESYARGIRSRRDVLLSHNAFGRISHITDIRKIHEAENKLQQAANRYYSNLSSQICDAFTQASQAEDVDMESLRMDLQRLRSNVYGRYSISLDNSLSNLYNTLPKQSYNTVR